MVIRCVVRRENSLYFNRLGDKCVSSGLATQKSSDVLAKGEGEDVVSRFSLKVFSFQGIDMGND